MFPVIPAALELTHPKLVMAGHRAGHPDTPADARRDAAAPSLDGHRQRVWVPGTASLRSWAGNDEQNWVNLAIQLRRRTLSWIEPDIAVPLDRSARVRLRAWSQ